MDELSSRLFGQGGAPAASAVLNLVGPAGSGKSVVLDQLYAHGCRSAAVVRLRFSADGVPLAEVVPELRILPGLATLPLDLPLQCAALRVSLEGAAVAPDTPWVLLLDGIDGLAAWPWLQDTLLRLALEQGHATVIVASRAPLYWHFWELADLAQIYHMPPLAEHECADLLPPTLVPELHSDLRTLSQGYPGSAILLAHRFGVAPPFDLDRLTPATRELVMTIGLLRAVQVPVMTAALTRFASSDDEQFVLQQQIMLALQELKRLQLTTYSRSEQTRFVPALRLAVESKLRVHDLVRLDELYCFFADWYFKAEPTNDRQALNEWLYFTACSLDDTAAASTDWLTRFEQKYYALEERATLASQIFADGELLARLQRAGCLDAIAKRLDGGAIRPALHRHADALLLALLGVANPDQAEELYQFARTAAGLGDSFSLNELSAALVQPRHRINAALALLLEHGVCLVDRQRYRLHPLFAGLVQWQRNTGQFVPVHKSNFPR
jgi:hypothetical protein